MYNIKVFLVAILISFASQKSVAQTIGFKTSSISICEKANGKWKAWSNFVPSQNIISIDAKKDLIVITSSDVQAYKINVYYDRIEMPTQDFVMFDCTDHNGSKCKIMVVTHKNENNRRQFYINYNEVKFVYNII